jgi:hypothetical protein
VSGRNIRSNDCAPDDVGREAEAWEATTLQHSRIVLIVLRDLTKLRGELKGYGGKGDHGRAHLTIFDCLERRTNRHLPSLCISSTPIMLLNCVAWRPQRWI